MSRAESIAQTYMDAVRALPCVLCRLIGRKQTKPTAAHHPRDGVGLSQRAGDFSVIALCWDCHQGPMGIHGDRTLIRMAKATEWDLHDATNEAVFKAMIVLDNPYF